MQKCEKCGSENQSESKFCQACGGPLAGVENVQAVQGPPPIPEQSSVPPVPPPTPSYQQAAQPGSVNPNKTPKLGLDRNVAGLLCYLVGWLSGLIMYLLEDDEYVKFNGMQSVVLFGGLHILRIVLGIFVAFAHHVFFLGVLLSPILLLINLATLVLWIWLMVKAYNGETYRVPFVADIVDKIRK